MSSSSIAPGASVLRADRARALLHGSPREVLARIAPDDALGLRASVGARLRERHLLGDAELVHLRTLARVAREARSSQACLGSEELTAWIVGQIDRAIDQGMAAIRASDGTVSAGSRGSALDGLALRLGFDPSSVDRACERFDSLPEPERVAFFAVVLEARSLDETAHALGTSVSEVARRARRALDIVVGTLESCAARPARGDHP
jgi:hypothetical protein